MGQFKLGDFAHFNFGTDIMTSKSQYTSRSEPTGPPMESTMSKLDVEETGILQTLINLFNAPIDVVT